MMDERMYMRIEKYLGGGMSADELIRFQKEIDSNIDLREEITLYNAINFHLTNNTQEDTSFYDTAYRQKLDTYIKSEEGKKIKENLLNIRKQEGHSFKKNKPKYRWFLYSLIPIAATVVLILSLFFNNTTQNDLYKEYYKVEELPSFTTRSGNSSLLSGIKSDFRTVNYDLSLAKIEEYIEKEGKDLDPLVYIYSGLIYAEKNDLSKAIEQFAILEKSNSIDRSKSLWYKALVYLKFEKKMKAKSVLILILENEHNYKYHEAKELLEEL